MDDVIVPPPLELAIASVRWSHQLVTQLDRDLRGQGLSVAKLRALLALREQRGLLHAGGLARKLDVSRQAAHTVLHRLEERGFITWRDDGWIKSARLTRDGEDALTHALGSIGTTLAALQQLQAEEQRAMIRIMRRAGEHVRRASAPQSPAWWMD